MLINYQQVIIINYNILSYGLMANNYKLKLYYIIIKYYSFIINKH